MAASERVHLATGFVLLATSVLVAWVEAASIVSLLVPPLVQIGGRDSLLLDCTFTVPDTTGLSVEWYFKPAAGAGEEEELVYRWLPPLAGEVAGVLRGRAVAEDMTAETPMRSRLRVLKPSVQLSGEYTCAVRSALGGEARRTRTMLFYSEVQDMRLEAQQRGNTVEVSCSVSGVYPDPDLTIERLNSPVAQESRVSAAQLSGGGGDEGLLDAVATARLPVRDLRANETFRCILRFMHTSHSVVKELKFRPTFNEVIVETPMTTATTAAAAEASNTGKTAAAGAARAGVTGVALALLLALVC